MPGPPPKPASLKKLNGNPSGRPINDGPAFKGDPKCPAFLTKAAKKEWNRVVKELQSLDMLRSVDSSSLAAYCQSYARWESAERIIEKEGQTVQEPITNKAGEVVGHKIRRHPAVTVSKDALSSMLRASALFGFDPSNRTRIQVSESTPEDPFEQFMKEMGAETPSHEESEYEPS